MAGNNEFDLLKERIDHLKEITIESLKSVDQKHDRWQKVQDDDIKEQSENLKEYRTTFSTAIEELTNNVDRQFKEVVVTISNLEKAIQAGDQRVVAELEKSKSEKTKAMVTAAFSVAGLIVAIVFGILQL